MANTVSILITAKDNASSVLASTAASLEATSKSMQRAGASMMDVGRQATAGLTLPIAAAGVAAISMAGDFERGLNILRSVTSATSEQMASLRKQAVALGNDLTLPGVSAADAAGAMTELAKAGLSVNDVLAASKGVLSLAKAGQLDVSDAAMTTARALNAFGLEGNQANRIADLLAASANASTAGVQDMALGLQMAGAQSHQMGVSLQDTVTALSLFSNAGINGSDAGTSLKQMFIQLATPTKQATELMNKLGLDFFDAKGNFIGLASTGQQLNDKLKALTVEQRNNALATIFGSDATRVAAILAQGGASAFNEMSVAVNKQGAAMDLAAAQNSGLNGALDNLRSTVETALIDIGTRLLPPLTKSLKSFADQVGALTDWFDHLSEGQQQMIFQTLTWTAVLGPALLVTGKMVKTIGTLVGAVGTVSKVFGLFSTGRLVGQAGLATRALGMAGMAGAAGQGVAAIGGAGGLLALLGPAAIAIGAVGLAAGGAYLLWKRFNDEGDRFGAGNGSGERARYAGQVDLVRLATDRLTDAQKAEQKSADALKASESQLVDAHTDVANTLMTVGTPQQDLYYQALAREATINLTVLSQTGDLASKRRELADATSNLKTLNEMLNGSLDGTAGAIAQLSPVSDDVGAHIDVLQGKISGISIAWNGFNGQVQSQITQVNDLLFGTSSTISQVQCSFGKLQASSSGIKISGGGVTIQGGGGPIQGHALGTNFASTDSFIAGEGGRPELVVGAKGATVYSPSETERMLNGSARSGVSIGNFNVYNNIDADAVIRKIGFKLANA